MSKTAGRVAKSENQDRTPRSGLVFTPCSDLSVRILTVIMVNNRLFRIGNGKQKPTEGDLPSH